MVAGIAAWTIFVNTKKHQCIINGDKEGWKLYSAITAGILMAVLTAFGYVLTNSLLALILFPTLVLVYSICHDCGMSYRLHKNNPELSWLGKFFQLGSSKWDKKIKEIFQGGILWFIFKAIWLGGAIVAYFSLKKSKIK